MVPTTRAKTIHVILNASSGFDEKGGTPAALERIIAKNGMESDIHLLDKSADLCEQVRDMVREGAEIIVAGGGDGTINAVASVLAGTAVTMGILPMGTLNHFARDLEIPFNPAQAMQVITEGRTMLVDVGEVNGKRFINNAILGLYPNYRFQRERHERRGRFKWLAILSAVVGVFRRNPALKIRIEAGGQSLERKTPFLMVANNRHEMEGYHLGRRQSLTSGQLSVYVMHRMSRWRLLRLAFSVLLGRFSKRRDFDLMDANSVTLESARRSIGVSLDGEVVRIKPPLHYKSLPKSLKVIVPASYKNKH
jgi:diacylglycerol kinase family enzyme